MAYDLLPGFLVRLATQSQHDHWQGGPAYHEGAVCRICDRPLLLLWDINCLDPRLRVRGRSVFKDLKRVPLYYCWKCAGDVDYRVVDSHRLEVLGNRGRPQGDDFPYKNYPLQFERRRISLDRLDELRKLSTRWNVDVGERLPASARKRLEKRLGHRVTYDFDIWWHQFGGRPWLVQGPENIVCPNEKCSWARRGWTMKILASIINDPPSGLPMIESVKEVKKNKGHFNSYVQVIFHICRGCLTLHAANRCD